MSKCSKCGNELLTGDTHWELGWCNNCYNELYKDDKTYISLDKIRLNIAQQFRDENEKLQDKVADLEAKLAECEKSKESYRLQNEHHHLQLLQFYSRLGVEAFGADIHEKALETLMIMKEQLAEKDKAIENWQTIYESVVQTCHNDKEEIERLNKKLETQENIITNLVEDNRASQEWYRKQLEEKDKEIEYQESMKILAVENQNKKAIEQLEKVKGLIANHTQELWTCENDDIDVVLYEEIDKQINELKGKVE